MTGGINVDALAAIIGRAEAEAWARAERLKLLSRPSRHEVEGTSAPCRCVLLPVHTAEVTP